MKRAMWAALVVVLGVLLLAPLPATATDKVGVCHRTASESHPYVFIEVPAENANGHITGTASQHNHSVTWPEAGTWNGVPHAAGDERLDYYATAADASSGCADRTPPPEEFTPYEVDVCWTMLNSDGVEGTYEFPQVRGCEPPACEETVEYQYDTYWIRDADDKAYLAQLMRLESPADDARLEPHDYYSDVVTNDEPCEPEVPVKPEPIVTEASSTALDCDDEVRVTTVTETTTPYVWDAELHEYVLGEPGEPVVVDVIETPVKPGVCDEEPPPVDCEDAGPPYCPVPEQPKPEPEPRDNDNLRVTNAAVPTAVDAGLEAPQDRAPWIPLGATALGVLMIAGAVRKIAIS